jgi:two-component system sensor histidine kinase/response regulator
MTYILLIEDNQQNADMMQHILTTEGYEVRHTVMGLEGAREAVKEVPALILLDFNLPDIDGKNLLLTFRRRLGSSVPVVACTAKTGEMEKRIAKSFGAAAFLGKPFSPDELLAVVKHFYTPSKAPSEK